MTLFHVAQEKLAYKVNGEEIKAFACIDVPYQQGRCPHSEYDLPLTRQTTFSSFSNVHEQNFQLVSRLVLKCHPLSPYLFPSVNLRTLSNHSSLVHWDVFAISAHLGSKSLSESFPLLCCHPLTVTTDAAAPLQGEGNIKSVWDLLTFCRWMEWEESQRWLQEDPSEGI